MLRDALRQLKDGTSQLLNVNRSILLFTKMIKGPGTSSQLPELNQKHVGNVCQNIHYIWAKFRLILASEKIAIKDYQIKSY